MVNQSLEDLVTQMNHGTPSRSVPVIDGADENQDERWTLPYWLIVLGMIIIFILEFFLAWRLGIPIGNGGGNLTGSIVTFGTNVF